MNSTTKQSTHSTCSTPSTTRGLITAFLILAASLAMLGCEDPTRIMQPPESTLTPRLVLTRAMLDNKPAINCTALAVDQGVPLAPTFSDELGVVPVYSSNRGPVDILVTCDGGNGGPAWGHIQGVKAAKRVVMAPTINLTRGTVPDDVLALYATSAN
jgi:hypothetical protein